MQLGLFLSFFFFLQGDIIALLRKVDSNWYEGRVGDRRGIVPSNYLEVRYFQSLRS